mmetsp:Transcript_50361/g.126153  ORF Transcript_50361/g.126153 Transcript_50361/m.126153 type:complete len:286 (-) Transcript_50361:55-912(-)
MQPCTRCVYVRHTKANRTSTKHSSHRTPNRNIPPSSSAIPHHVKHLYLIRYEVIRPAQISTAIFVPLPRIARRQITAIGDLHAAADVRPESQIKPPTDLRIRPARQTPLPPRHHHKVIPFVDVDLGGLGEVAGQREEPHITLVLAAVGGIVVGQQKAVTDEGAEHIIVLTNDEHERLRVTHTDKHFAPGRPVCSRPVEWGEFCCGVAQHPELPLLDQQADQPLILRRRQRSALGRGHLQATQVDLLCLRHAKNRQQTSHSPNKHRDCEQQGRGEEKRGEIQTSSR